MMRRSSLSSAALGLVGLTLAAVIVGRVDSHAVDGQAGITPVVIATTGSDGPTEKTATPHKTADAAKAIPKPATSGASSGQFQQVSPKPRDIQDDKSGVRGGDDTSTGDSGTSGGDDTSSGDSGGDDTSSGDSDSGTSGGDDTSSGDSESP